MEPRNLVDVSCFLLVEASGDSSEADSNSDPFTAVVGRRDAAAVAADDDDAESCSCDFSDYYVRVNELKDWGFLQEYDCEDKDDDGEEEEEEEVNSIDRNYSGKQRELPVKITSGLMTTAAHHQKSRVSVDSTNEVMNEMEKNRLFWEACLAS